MNKILFFCLGCSIAFLVSCNSKKKEAPKLNEDQFINMLIDIHTLDGILSSQNIFRSGKNYRPSYYYNHIYQKYGVSPEQFDSCLYYYSNNTSRFTKMYDQIIDSLNRLETKLRIDVKNEKLERDTVNLWVKQQYWRIPKEGNNLSFSIPVNEKGLYTVKAKIKLYDNDQTVNPRIEAYFWKKDSLGDTIKVYFEPVPIRKSTDFVTYQSQLEYPDSTYTHLGGNLFKGDNDLPEYTQNCIIRNIMVFNPQIRPDSIDVMNEIEMHRVR